MLNCLCNYRSESAFDRSSDQEMSEMSFDYILFRRNKKGGKGGRKMANIPPIYRYQLQTASTGRISLNFSHQLYPLRRGTLLSKPTFPADGPGSTLG